jgi:predicted MFS family arabinose efflux permease
VTYGLARFALGLFMPELRATFGLSATSAGWVMAGSFGGYVGALVLVGPLAARLGARTIAIGAGVVAAVGMAGVAVASGPVVLAAAATVGGASTGFASPALATAVEQRVAAVRRASAQTAINAGTSLGLIAAVPVALVVTATWRAAWMVFTLAAVAASAAVAITLGPEPDRHTRPPRPRGPLSARLRAAAMLLGVSSAAFWGFARELLETVSGLSPGVGRSVWLAVGIGGLAGAAGGHLAARVGLLAALVVSWLPLVGSLAWLAAGPASPPLALALAGAFGAGYMALTGLLIVWSVWERPARPASAVASAFLVLAAGQIAGSPLAGAVADRLGLSATFFIAAVVAAAGALALPPRHAAATPAQEQERQDETGPGRAT